MIYRDHELVVRVTRCGHAAGPWSWRCCGSHCQPCSGHAESHAAAIEDACQHLADAVHEHHQVEHATEGGDGRDSQAECRCGAERHGRPETNAAESDLEWHITWAAESVPAAYRGSNRKART